MAEEERTRRRAIQRARIRRRRKIATTTLLALIIGAIGVVVSLSGVLTGNGDQAVLSAPVMPLITSAPMKAAAPGSKANETERVARASAHAGAEDADRPLRGRTIAIDPGHNGSNYLHSAEINRQVDAGTLHKACDTTGTQTNDGYTEAEYTLDVGLRLATILRREGAKVVMTRTTNSGWGPCITKRAAIGNRVRADAAVSIHADGGPASGRGFHVIYPPAEPGLVTNALAATDRRLALRIRNAYRATGMPTSTYLGIAGLDERSDLGGLNLSSVPKVFIETGNMRNLTDARLLESREFRQRAARAIAEGIAAFLRRQPQH